MKYIMICMGFISLALAGCGKSDGISNSNMNGKWIESVSRKDTIEFKDGDLWAFQATNHWMYLKGEWENNRPKYFNTGILNYQITGDSIGLHNMIMSSFNYPKYYFKIQNNNSFLVGNFYKTDRTDLILQFVRM